MLGAIRAGLRVLLACAFVEYFKDIEIRYLPAL